MYGLETLAIGRRQKAKLEVAELKMLRLSLGVTGRTESGTWSLDR